MTPSALRIIGLVLLIAAAGLMVLNLRRVAGAGTFWIGIPPLIVGVLCVSLAKKGGKK